MLKAEWISTDIETGGGEVTCVGFSDAKDYAICIPTNSPTRQAVIKAVLRAKVPKIFHNAPYDVPYLRHHSKFEVNGEIHDTLAMAQALHPELPRSLGVLTSIYTNQPYYKDLGTLWKKTGDLHTYWRYNALDAACTREVADELRERLNRHGLWSVYERTRRVLPHALDMSVRGIKYDTARAAILKARAEKDARRYQAILDGRVGRAVNVNSYPQVTKLLYGDLGLPTRKRRGSDGLASDQKSILSLYPAVADRRVRQLLRSLLRVRHARKFSSSYLSVSPSDDGRMRSSFNPAGTETGRWTASKFLIVEGTNLQTPTPAWKECFEADEGFLFWNCDYSQIEARIVSYLAGDARSIAIFESGGDIHRANAAIIFQKPEDQVTARERDIGKSVHALNYGVGAEELMLMVNKRALDTGVWISKNLAAHVRTTYLNNFDQVVRWQEETWERGRKERCLYNPFGRRRIFLGPTSGQGSEHTKKEMLAFVPQSTVPDMLNSALCTLREEPPCPGLEVFLNIHDALFGQGPITTRELWQQSVVTAMESQTISLSGRTVTIPVDLQVGPRWGKSMKKIPRSSSAS